MENTLTSSVASETMSVIDPAVLRVRNPESGAWADRLLMSSMRGLGVDPSHAYSEMLNEMKHELAVARQTIDMLHEHNTLIGRQLNEARRREAQAREFAYRDELTGLANRRLMMDRLQLEMAHADRHHTQVALLLIDLDGFKAINDTFGHAAGDQLLREVAARLVGCVRASDTACRYGGDEFIVVMPELDGPQALKTATDKIRSCMEKPYLIDGVDMSVGASIGCAVYPADGTTYQSLIEKADAKMYRVKAKRKLRDR